MRDPAEVVASTPWHELFHAYGVASDTRGHLEAFVDPHGEVVPAREHLASAIVHQGTVWTASPAALAVAIDVLARDLTGARFTDSDVIDLLSTLAEAGEVNQVAFDTEPVVSEDVRAHVAELLSGDEDEVEDALEELFDGDPRGDAVMARAAWEVQQLRPAVVALLDQVEVVRPHLEAVAEHVRLAWPSN
jgi:hypothetical protein